MYRLENIHVQKTPPLKTILNCYSKHTELNRHTTKEIHCCTGEEHTGSTLHRLTVPKVSGVSLLWTLRPYLPLLVVVAVGGTGGLLLSALGLLQFLDHHEARLLAQAPQPVAVHVRAPLDEEHIQVLRPGGRGGHREGGGANCC